MPRENECGHPERKHQARGMCNSCYVMWRRSKCPRTRRLKNEANRRYAARKREENPDHNWESKILCTYGITKEEFYALWSKHGNCCSVCKSPDNGSRRMCVDHCHETGKVRGILCDKCNTGIGLLGDTESGVYRALTYLNPFSGYDGHFLLW